jgi:hypothetical protein
MIDLRLILFTPIALLLSSCRLGKSDDDPATRPLPIVSESAAPAAQAEDPLADRDPALPQARPRKAPTPEAQGAPDPAPPDPDNKPRDPSAASPNKKETETAAPAPEASTAPPSAASAPILIKAPNPECFGKCAAALQSCLAAATTDGNPDLGKSSKCGGAFDTCKNGCLQ